MDSAIDASRAGGGVIAPSGSSGRPGRGLGLFSICLVVVVLQLCSRFLASPAADLTCDDWAFLRSARACPSYRSAWHKVLQEPDRPLQAAVATAVFKFIDDRPWGYAFLSMVGHSILIMLGMVLVWQLTGDPARVFLFGCLFALLPNLVESFHWQCVVVLAIPAQMAYLLCALFWVFFLRRPRIALLLCSALFYGVGITSYEFGVGLPLALMMLIPMREWPRRGWVMSPYLLVLSVYLLWKLTCGFGTAHGVWAAPRRPELSAWGILWNAKEIAYWWLGRHMLAAILNGWAGFIMWGKWAQRAVCWLDVALVVLLARLCGSLCLDDKSVLARRALAFPFRRVLLFGAAWFLAVHAVSLVSWAPARLNYLPGMGLCLCAALLLGRIPRRAWLPCLPVLALICLVANQGTARNWHEAGRYHRRVYEYLARTEPEWAGKEVIFFDTSRLRHRLTRGLTGQSSRGEAAWAYYGNAVLPRGFTFKSMVRLIQPNGQHPECVMDTEHGAAVAGDRLIWHERYDPTRPRRTDMNRVLVVDCFEVGAAGITPAVAARGESSVAP